MSMMWQAISGRPHGEGDEGGDVADDGHPRRGERRHGPLRQRAARAAQMRRSAPREGRECKRLTRPTPAPAPPASATADSPPRPAPLHPRHDALPPPAAIPPTPNPAAAAPCAGPSPAAANGRNFELERERHLEREPRCYAQHTDARLLPPHALLGVPAQVEIESKIEAKLKAICNVLVSSA